MNSSALKDFIHLFIFDLNFLLQLKLFNITQVGKWSDMSNKHGLPISSFLVILEKNMIY